MKNKTSKKEARVLFVDDEMNILSAIRRALADEEYLTHFASSGAEALDLMDKYQMDVIVTDMKMPGMDGLQLLKAVKQKYPQTVRIVLSGYTQLSQVLATVNQADIFQFITKPWNAEGELRHVVNRAIEYHSLIKTEAELKHALEQRNLAYQNVLKKLEGKINDKNLQLEIIKTISNILLEPTRQQNPKQVQWLTQVLNDATQDIWQMQEQKLSALIQQLQQQLTVQINAKAPELEGTVEDSKLVVIRSHFILFALTTYLNFLQTQNILIKYSQISIKDESVHESRLTVIIITEQDINSLNDILDLYVQIFSNFFEIKHQSKASAEIISLSFNLTD